MLQALIFDVDGTLAETEDLHRRSFNEAFRQAGPRLALGRRALRGSCCRRRVAASASSATSPTTRRTSAACWTSLPALYRAKTSSYLALMRRRRAAAAARRGAARPRGARARPQARHRHDLQPAQRARPCCAAASARTGRTGSPSPPATWRRPEEAGARRLLSGAGSAAPRPGQRAGLRGFGQRPPGGAAGWAWSRRDAEPVPRRRGPRAAP